MRKNMVERSDKDKKHNKYKPVFDEEMDLMFDTLVHKRRKFDEFFIKSANFIKANGLFSQKAIEEEAMAIDRNSPSKKEIQALDETWEMRHRCREVYLNEYLDALEDLRQWFGNNKVLQNNDKPLEGVDEVVDILTKKSMKRKEVFDAYMDGVRNASDKHRDNQV